VMTSVETRGRPTLMTSLEVDLQPTVMTSISYVIYSFSLQYLGLQLIFVMSIIIGSSDTIRSSPDVIYSSYI